MVIPPQYNETYQARKVGWDETCSKCMYGLSKAQLERGKCKCTRPHKIAYQSGIYCVSYTEKEKK